MRYVVAVADPESGREFQFPLSADDRQQAEAIVIGQGLLISKIQEEPDAPQFVVHDRATNESLHLAAGELQTIGSRLDVLARIQSEIRDRRTRDIAWGIFWGLWAYAISVWALLFIIWLVFSVLLAGALSSFSSRGGGFGL